MKTLLVYQLIRTTQRLTFDILEQAPEVTFMDDDDGEYFKFVASNGYEVISRSRMDIQTERLWLLGARSFDERRSGSMVFSSDEKRDTAYSAFVKAINEWAAHHGGGVVEYAAAAPAPQAQQGEPVAWAGVDLDGMVEALNRVTEAQGQKTPFHQPMYSDAMMAMRELRGLVAYMKRNAGSAPAPQGEKKC